MVNIRANQLEEEELVELVQSGWSQLSPALTFDPLPIPASAAFVAGSHVTSVSLAFVQRRSACLPLKETPSAT